MQIDKLVQLLESPIFMRLRLQLLEVNAPFYPYIMRSLYGLLMLLPQSAAYRTLATRLDTACSLQRNLTAGSGQPMLAAFTPAAAAVAELAQDSTETASSGQGSAAGGSGQEAGGRRKGRDASSSNISANTDMAATIVELLQRFRAVQERHTAARYDAIRGRSLHAASSLGSSAEM